MNDTLKTIAERYSCRAYDGRAVEQEKLEAVTLAAVQAPSAMNRQPWEIVVITDKAFIDEMDAVAMTELAAREDKTFYERIKQRGGKIFYNAPCMIVVVKKKTANFDTFDCGIATQNIALAAHSLGLANVICAMAGIPLNGPRGAEFKERIGIAGDDEFGMAVLLGYTDSPGKPHEPDLSKIRFI